jgi:hypothetical protein
VRSQLIEEEQGKSKVSLLDLIVGKAEFDTSKAGKVQDPRAGGYMLTADNESAKEKYNLAKEDRMRKENELEHRVIHPLFEKTEEQLREHDSNLSKQAEEQKRNQEI